jgi:hypothetical protein
VQCDAEGEKEGGEWLKKKAVRVTGKKEVKRY